jgi:hypothetical protein
MRHAIADRLDPRAGDTPVTSRRDEVATEQALRRLAKVAAADPRRPACHFRPPGGWMNDPNGTLWDGEHFHLFYQHNPFDDAWGDIHWGHAGSRDLVHWKHFPIALSPEHESGEDHCFSGGAWTDSAGRHWLLYSSVSGTGKVFEASQRLVACGPGLTTFQRVEGEAPLEREAQGQPTFGPRWRDPFVFDTDGRTFLTLAADLPARGGSSVFPLFESPERHPGVWEYRGPLYEPPPGESRYHECPNVVSVAGRHVLVFSPHGPVEYRSGHFDPDAAVFDVAGGGRVDHGTCFYATNVYPTGCRDGPVLVGWVRGWDRGRGWNGILGVPRAIDLDEAGRLLQRPISALQSLRRLPGGRVDAGELGAAVSIEGVRAPAVEVDVVLRPPSDGSCGVRLRGVSTGRIHVEARVGRPRGWVELGGIAFEHRPGCSAERGLHLFWDRTVAELFLDGGRDVCTWVDGAATGEPVTVELFSDGGAGRIERAEAWELDAIWPEEVVDE